MNQRLISSQQRYILKALFFVVGFVSITAQIVFFKEAFICFNRNLFVMVFVLINWVVAGGIGAFLWRRFSVHHQAIFLMMFILLLSVLLPVTSLGFQALGPVFFNCTVGFLVVIKMIGASFVVMAPVAMLLGVLLMLIPSLYRQYGFLNFRIVWFYQALGALMGGLVTGFILINQLLSLVIMCRVSMILLMMGLLFGVYFVTYSCNKVHRFLNFILILCMCVVVFFIFIGFKLGLFHKIHQTFVEKQQIIIEADTAR